MTLEGSLVLNRHLHRLLGAESLAELKGALKPIEEGPGPDGQSRFFHALAARRGLRVPEGKLAEYDARVVSYEACLQRARGPLRLKYFQYLPLLYAELYLDRLTADPQDFLRELNEPRPGEAVPFKPADLRRLALFMATGSGKTLLLHANLWQILHYLERGRHPEALVDRADGRREFDSLLLVTPNEGLSEQHLAEFRLSGIEATRLVEDRAGRGVFGPRVKVIEISKLAEEPSREGVSVLLEELGPMNLVFVDEGHKGTGSEARTWKRRQQRLSSRGLLLEYSATFAQSIGAAPSRERKRLIEEYGKTILFDYSYRHFYDDGYGKDFSVLNLERAREEMAHELLLGGLLVFFQQVKLFRENEALYRPYGVEPPLWVFLGSSVNAVFTHAGRVRSDVAVVIGFLKRVLEDRGWAVETIGRILHGESGFRDGETGQDLFKGRLNHIQREVPGSLYDALTSKIFHGRGGIEVWRLKNAEGELGLRVSAPEGGGTPYFGLVNVGDAAALEKHLEASLGISLREDRFTPSLFAQVNAPGSPVNLLVGAKKFIEGWSSWRVSAMGLLNVGKGEGPQVIQLFGRGVRLKGKRGSLKRSACLPEEAPHPDGLKALETLFIFGWNADYLQRFREMLNLEELGRVVELETRRFDPWPDLPIPVRKDYDPRGETWTVVAEEPFPVIDLTPRLTTLAGVQGGRGEAGPGRPVTFSDADSLSLLDLEALYRNLEDYKDAREYGNVFFRRAEVRPVLEKSTLVLREEGAGDPRVLQEGGLQILKTYLDRFVSRREREAEARRLGLGILRPDHENVISRYVLRVSSEDLLREILDLLRRRGADLLATAEGGPLPRLHVDAHLYNPLLLDPGESRVHGLSVSPPGLRESERDFVRHLMEFWTAHHHEAPYRGLEIYLLRNQPRVGVGFFRRSGFYPDLILWVKEGPEGPFRIMFLEPHGLHHGGVESITDKGAALGALDELGSEESFARRKITLGGYILTDTPLAEIPGARGKQWQDLERDYRVLPQGPEAIRKILSGRRAFALIDEPPEELKFKEYLPVYTLEAAAGTGLDSPEKVLGWARVEPGAWSRGVHFIARVAGRSMEPDILDGSWVLFRRYEGGTRQGKIVLASHRKIRDPELGEGYTVKRYFSVKEPLPEGERGDWRHARIELRPSNPDYAVVRFDRMSEDELATPAIFEAVLVQEGQTLRRSRR